VDLVVNVVVEVAVLSFGIGIVIGQIKNLMKKVDEMIQAQHECRESLPYKFALKESVSGLESKIEKIASDLRYMQGRANGK